MSTGTLLVGDYIWSIIIPMEQLGQMTQTELRVVAAILTSMRSWPRFESSENEVP